MLGSKIAHFVTEARGRRGEVAEFLWMGLRKDFIHGVVIINFAIFKDSVEDMQCNLQDTLPHAGPE